ncbi:PAS domain S-box protein [Thermodesulfobacteriota bacterium]
MNKEISCNNFIGLLDFLRKHYGDDGVQQVVDGLVDNTEYLIANKDDPSKITPVQEHHLNDSAYWVSNEFSLALLANVKKVVTGANPLFTAGEGAVFEQLSKSILFISRVIGPKMISKRATKVNARFNRTKDVRLVDLSDHSATFELHYYPNFRVTKDVCNWNRGIYSSVAKVSGATSVKCEEVKCVVNGDECCAFSLKWKKPNPIKQTIQWLMKSSITDLIADYELTIKDRDQLIERLSRSEKRFRDLVENINELIYAVDQNGTVTYASPAVKRLGGYEPSEITGKNFLDFVFEEDIPFVMERFQAILNLKTLEPVEFRILEKSGATRWVNTSSRPVLENETVVGLQGVMSDLTALKESEKEKKSLVEKLARSQKMEALGLLAGGVAHDLNNVLSGIVSYPDLLLMDLPEDSPMRKPIATIRDSGKKAAAVVQDLLTLARRGVTDTDVINLNDIVSEYLKSPEHETLKNLHPGADIETHLDDNLLNIKGSAVHLKNTVMNLISNAAEALPLGGNIIISTENRYVDRPTKGYDIVSEGDFVVLKVADNGTGIAGNDLKRIFEPFYTKKALKRSGTGLGMAVVWGTVQDHHGHLDVESTEGKGTTFELIFPIVREPLTGKTPSIPLEDYMGSGEAILIVDDVKAQREIAADMLTRLGYAVTVVSSGEDSVEHLKKNSADLILLDMIMDPGIDGLETYRRILESNPGQKAIIASGFSETEQVKEARNLGAGAYIKKPYTLEKIGMSVKQELIKAKTK